MRPPVLVAVVVSAFTFATAAAPARAGGGGDTIPATGGAITVTPIAHATLQLSFG